MDWFKLGTYSGCEMSFLSPRRKAMTHCLNMIFLKKMGTLREEARPLCLNGDLLIEEKSGPSPPVKQGQEIPLDGMNLDRSVLVH